MEQFAVIGLGRFGTRLATLLAEAGADIIAIDRNPELVASIRDRVPIAVCLNSTDENALRAQGIDKVDVAVVGIGADFEDSVLTTVILKQLGVPRVISRAATRTRGQILSRIGADDIVNPEQESADRWCSRLLAPAVIERIELAEGYSLIQVVAPKSFQDKSLEQLSLRKKYGVNVVAIRRTAEETDSAGKKISRQYVISVPMADTLIKPNDILVLIGSDDSMQSLPSE